MAHPGVGVDDRSLQFALFMGIVAAFLLLVVVGVEIVRRARAMLRQRRTEGAVPVKQDHPR